MTNTDGILVISLRAARSNRGYSLNDVSKLTPYSKDQIHKCELDSSNISFTMLETLLDLYQVSMRYIFLGKESDFIGKYREKLKENSSETA